MNATMQTGRRPRHDQEAREAGRDAGRRWAEQIATLVQLRHLARLAEPDMIGYDAAEVADYFRRSEGWEPAVELAGDLIAGPTEWDREAPGRRAEAARFWRRAGVSARQADSGDFLYGFFVEALAAWRQG